MKKRLSILLLVFGMLWTTFSISVCAASPYPTYQYYYEQLDTYGKEIYQLFLSNTDALMEARPIVLEKDLTKAQYEQFSHSVQPATQAYLQDHSEIFWCGGWGLRSLRENSKTSGVFHYTLTFSLTPDFSWSAEGGRSVFRDFAALRAAVVALAEEIRAVGNTRYVQLLWLHDWLTANNIYNSAAAQSGPGGDSTPWSPLSALDYSLSPICEGYSRAFQLVCLELGIPCILVSGGDHMWNYVQMENQAWYAVDVTYDDPVYTVNGITKTGPLSGGENHDYFLIGKKLLADHRLDQNFVYPALSDTDYDPTQASVDTLPLFTAPPLSQLPDSTQAVAYPSIQTVQVDGIPVQFQMYAVKDAHGNDTNYVKLRDLAQVLRESPSRFSVTWNGGLNVIDITPGADYTPNGSEMYTPFSGTRAYTAMEAETRMFGVSLPIQAILLQDDAGNGYTYYKLRDLGNALGFYVDWTPERGVYVETAF